MTASKTNTPLVLNGRVYVYGALEEDFPGQLCARNPEPGALRIHSHLDQAGRDARSRGFCKSGYSGVIRASIFDGKSWRKFMLARECRAEDRKFSQFSERPGKARLLMRVLAALKGKTCVYRDGAFAVAKNTPVLTEKPTPAAEAAEKTKPAAAGPVQGSLFPEEGNSAVSTQCKNRSRQKSRRRRKPLMVITQIEIF